MNRDIYVIAEHLKGKLADITFEMSAKGEIWSTRRWKALPCLARQEWRPPCRRTQLADTVVVLDHEQLAEFNPEAYQRVLAELLGRGNPGSR